MRGDRPRLVDRFPSRLGFTPHARGSTLYRFQSVLSFSVYPACAGIDPTNSTLSNEEGSLPRMRGDRPFDWFVALDPIRFTPHARGSTPAPLPPPHTLRVYPACAGIDLSEPNPDRRSPCLPRMRGDRPVRSKPTIEQSV